MIQVITVIAFLLLAADIPFAIAVNIGLKLKENDPNCPEEQRDVRGNKRAIKLYQTVNTIAWLVVLILLVCLK